MEDRGGIFPPPRDGEAKIWQSWAEAPAPGVPLASRGSPTNRRRWAIPEQGTAEILAESAHPCWKRSGCPCNPPASHLSSGRGKIYDIYKLAAIQCTSRLGRGENSLCANTPNQTCFCRISTNSLFPPPMLFLRQQPSRADWRQVQEDTTLPSWRHRSFLYIEIITFNALNCHHAIKTANPQSTGDN